MKRVPRKAKLVIGGTVLTLASAGVVTNTNSCSPPPTPELHNVELIYQGTFSADEKRQIITGTASLDAKLHTYTAATFKASEHCLFLAQYNRSVKNIAILIRKASIDGVGNVIANGTLCQSRGTGQTVFGYITFDTSDYSGVVQRGFLSATALHEAFHVLGFGTSLKWRAFIKNGLFTGPLTVDTCRTTSCPGGLTVSADGHWLATGRIMSREIINSTQLARIDVAVLKDLNY